MIHDSPPMPLMSAPHHLRPFLLLALALGAATAVPLLVLASS
jgi:hypothetical protein